MPRAALLSVSDRTGLVELSRALSDAGFTLLATSGTTKFLSESKIETLPIEQYTGQKEILDGRVKTLHPKIHGGLLAKRDNPTHVAQLESEGIMPIEVAVINLYPFIQNLSGDKAKNLSQMVELIDIGGPTMIRAAAKNFSHVLPVIDPADYPRVVEYIKGGMPRDAKGMEFRRELSAKVFTTIARYNLEIAKYLTHAKFEDQGGKVQAVVDLADDLMMGETAGVVLSRAQTLRYGENPHQLASFYRETGSGPRSWEQLNGKELSYNNLLDFDAALRLIRSLAGEKPACCIMKHLNPCGAARGATLFEALKRSKRGDPRSHFGGVLAFSTTVTEDVATDIREDFAEIVIAPDYTPEALKILQTSKALRVIKVPVATPNAKRFEMRMVEGGVLIQEQDSGVSKVEDAEIVSSRKPTSAELNDLSFAWAVCAHVKSNSIVLAKDQTLLGVGAGQMSRIDSVELALSKCKTHEHDTNGAVCASDAFFPFPDSVETLGAAGIKAVIAPKGAKKDAEAIASANTKGMSLLFTGDRHFRH